MSILFSKVTSDLYDIDCEKYQTKPHFVATKASRTFIESQIGTDL